MLNTKCCTRPRTTNENTDNKLKLITFFKFLKSWLYYTDSHTVTLLTISRHPLCQSAKNAMFCTMLQVLIRLCSGMKLNNLTTSATTQWAIKCPRSHEIFLRSLLHFRKVTILNPTYWLSKIWAWMLVKLYFTLFFTTRRPALEKVVTIGGEGCHDPQFENPLHGNTAFSTLANGSFYVVARSDI
jgi:hypothetical protein